MSTDESVSMYLWLYFGFVIGCLMERERGSGRGKEGKILAFVFDFIIERLRLVNCMK